MVHSPQFDKYFCEHAEFIRRLSLELGFAENGTVEIGILQSVLHTFRKCLTVQQSIDVLNALPPFLKLYFVDGWLRPEEDKKLCSPTEFYNAVDNELAHAFGRAELKCTKSTPELVNIVLCLLRIYVDDNCIQKIFEKFPPELYPLFRKINS